MPDSPYTFGAAIRAARLGYRYSAKQGGFVRISDHRGGFRVDFAPPDGVPNDRTPTGQYRAWWDDAGTLDESDVLRCVRRVKRPFTILLDEDGDLVPARKEGAA